MDELIVLAVTDNLPKVIDFITSKMEKYDCSMKAVMQVQIAVEELYINIVNYAYNPEVGEAKICVEMKQDPLQIIIRLFDSGHEYNPLKKEDPNINKSAEEREIGGLGIFLAKKNMDEIEYRYENDCNVITLKKKI